ncbi:MAG: hypothetical protein ABID87_03975, partial [Chloroflexota bacterium]
PTETVGILPPGKGAATVWKIAVNGVMAGCRPEYMPVLIAIIEAVATPRFGLQHAGSTVGWTPLIILNGPIARQLDFNCGQGVLRPERQANITVSRFLRLAMVNIARFHLGETDMATFGRNYYPVLAEDEENSPWPPLCADRGFPAGANVVTVQSADCTAHNFLTIGDGEEQLSIIAREVARELGGPIIAIIEHMGPEFNPLVCVSPLVAGIIAKAGYSKDDVRKYLYEHARVTVEQFNYILNVMRQGDTVPRAVREGRLPEEFGLSDDPERLVPVMHRPEEMMIAVSGAPARNRSFVVGQFGNQGLSVSQEIKLPAGWQPPRRARG